MCSAMVVGGRAHVACFCSLFLPEQRFFFRPRYLCRNVTMSWSGLGCLCMPCRLWWSRKFGWGDSYTVNQTQTHLCHRIGTLTHFDVIRMWQSQPMWVGKNIDVARCPTNVLDRPFFTCHVFRSKMTLATDGPGPEVWSEHGAFVVLRMFFLASARLSITWILREPWGPTGIE